MTNRMLAIVVVLFFAAPSLAAVRVGAAQRLSLTAGSPRDTITSNAEHIGLMVQNSSYLDFIAFPEFSLTGNFDFSCNSESDMLPYSEVLPQPGQSVDCSASTWAPLQHVACKAPQNVTVSYNTVEQSGASVYNTQVIVRNKAVIALYRKYHPFYTKCFAKPSLELVTFEVKGLTFGVFTCYDILFPDPKDDLVKKGIRYFSYSSAIPLIGQITVDLFSGLNHVTVVSANNDLGMGGVAVNGTFVSQCSAKATTCIAAHVL